MDLKTLIQFDLRQVNYLVQSFADVYFTLSVKKFEAV